MNTPSMGKLTITLTQAKQCKRKDDQSKKCPIYSHSEFSVMLSFVKF